jgi:hypothetical protein
VFSIGNCTDGVSVMKHDSIHVDSRYGCVLVSGASSKSRKWARVIEAAISKRSV